MCEQRPLPWSWDPSKRAVKQPLSSLRCSCSQLHSQWDSPEPTCSSAQGLLSSKKPQGLSFKEDSCGL